MKILLLIFLIVAGWYIYDHYEQKKLESESNDDIEDAIDDATFISPSQKDKTTPQVNYLVEEKKLLAELAKQKTPLYKKYHTLNNQINLLKQKEDIIKKQFKDAELQYINKKILNTTNDLDVVNYDMKNLQNSINSMQRELDAEISRFKIAEAELKRKKEFYQRNMSKVSAQKAAEYRKNMAEDETRIAQTKATAQKNGYRLREKILKTQDQLASLNNSKDSTGKMPEDKTLKKDFAQSSYAQKAIQDIKPLHEERSKLEKQFEELGKEIDTIDQEIEKHYKKHEELRSYLKSDPGNFEEASFM